MNKKTKKNKWRISAVFVGWANFFRNIFENVLDFLKV